MRQVSRGKLVVPTLALGVVIAVLLLSRRSDFSSLPDATSPQPVVSERFLAADFVVVPTPTPTATPTPTPVPSPVRLVIPIISVDAPMVEVGVRPDGTVEEPRGPDEVAWTNGSARPGSGGNAVLSGHYDWSLPAPRGAVFYRLSYLKLGDKATIFLEDGSELVYEVVSSARYLASSAPAAEILGPSPDDVITLITCEGTFYRETRDYSHRRVVVARRVLP